ncbi:MAG: MMPL family transporter [Rhodobacteraceae bacterium]|nr:MMPL family transporter [Paracoccaceae bacterium]
MGVWFLILRGIFRLQRVCFAHKRFVLVLTAFLVALVGYGSFSIKTSNDPFLLFGPGNTYRQKLERQNEAFGETNQTLMLLAVKSTNDRPRLLEAERALFMILDNPDSEFALTDMTSFTSVSSLLPAMGYPLELTSLEDVEILLDERAALGKVFFNKDHTATILSIKLDLQDQSDGGLQRAYAGQNALAEQMRSSFPDVDIAFTGSVSMGEALRDGLSFDRKYLFPLTLVVNFLVLLFAFRNFRIAIATLGTGIASVLMTTGLAGWSGHVFATAAVSSFSIIMTLTVASLIHIIHSIGKRQRNLRFQKLDAIILASFRKLAIPVILAHATTAVGFLSLNWADSPAFRSMGNLVAIGLIFSLVLVLFVAPVVLSATCGNLKIRDESMRRLSRFFTKSWARGPKLWGIVVGFASVMAVLGLVRTTFDDQFIRFFPPEHPLRENIQTIADNMGWSQTVDLVLRYDDGELLTPNAFQELSDFVDKLQALEQVVDIRGPLPIVQNCLEHRTPPYTGSLADVPEKMLNFCVRSNYYVTEEFGNATFAADFRELRMSLLVKRQSSAHVRKLAETVEAMAAEAGFTGDRAAVSGVNVMSAYLSKVNTQSMLVGSAIAMVVVSILIGVFLRSIPLALLSILPNFIPSMAALGLWVWFNGEVGMAASIIAALTFGIVVDDTIHILYALNRGRKKQTDRGVQRVLQNVLPGVLTTTAALGFGFALLMFSGFEVNQQLGFLTAATIFIAFLFDLFVLPSLYILFIGRNRKP